MDEPAYVNLISAAAAQGVQRLVYVSARGLTADSIVDFFRIKHRIEGTVRGSAIPWVILRPSAFIDVWIDVIMGEGSRRSTVATVFGPGTQAGNYIASDDVAAFVQAILADPSVCNEIVDIGGPSEVSLLEFSRLIQRGSNLPEKRRHIPTAVLAVGRRVVRPFSEVGARLMSLGYWTTLENRSFPEWRISAERFGIQPRSVEAYLAQQQANR